MIPDLVYTSKDLYVSNQVRSKPIYLLSLEAISLYIKSFCHLVNALTFIKFVIKTMVLKKLTSVQEKSLSCI